MGQDSASNEEIEFLDLKHFHFGRRSRRGSNASFVSNGSTLQSIPFLADHDMDMDFDHMDIKGFKSRQSDSECEDIANIEDIEETKQGEDGEDDESANEILSQLDEEEKVIEESREECS